MKFLFSLFLLVALVGCAKTKPAADAANSQSATNTPAGPVLTPSTEKIGRVAMVNEAARFVVLRFPIGEVAANGQELTVYRNDVKVGVVRVTGPQRETDTVASILAGDPVVDDEVRGN